MVTPGGIAHAGPGGVRLPGGRRRARSRARASREPRAKPRQAEDRGRERRAAKRPPPEPRARPTAIDLAKGQRDISVSEFFAKNRHLLGFDNPSKALLTTVKEGVDNALDACEEAGILPDVRVEIREISETRFQVAIEDNGPGIVRAQVPKIFGSLLYGSKFHRLRQSRGQQGIGISAAGHVRAAHHRQADLDPDADAGQEAGASSRARDRHQAQRAADQARRDLRVGEAARHARRDRAGGGLPRRTALRRRLHPADLAREPARADHLRAAQGRGARRGARLPARDRRGAAGDARDQAASLRRRARRADADVPRHQGAQRVLVSAERLQPDLVAHRRRDLQAREGGAHAPAERDRRARRRSGCTRRSRRPRSWRRRWIASRRSAES